MRYSDREVNIRSITQYYWCELTNLVQLLTRFLCPFGHQIINHDTGVSIRTGDGKRRLITCSKTRVDTSNTTLCRSFLIPRCPIDLTCEEEPLANGQEIYKSCYRRPTLILLVSSDAADCIRSMRIQGKAVTHVEAPEDRYDRIRLRTQVEPSGRFLVLELYAS